MPVGNDPALLALLALVRIAITIFCIVRAGKLHRSRLGWGLFGFFLPVIAFIVILLVKSKRPKAAPETPAPRPVLPTERTATQSPRKVAPLPEPTPAPVAKPPSPPAVDAQGATEAAAERARVADVARQQKAERQRKAAAFPRRANWPEFEKVLTDHGIRHLYHFTDRANLESIKRHGGLYSWSHCEQNGIRISRPGGNVLSRNLDTRGGLEDYVRLSFHHDPLMLFVAKRDGRITDPVMLQVDPEVVYWETTKFCDGNATANIAHTGGTLDDLRRVRFDVIKRGRWADDLEKHYLQAEVLVKTHVPARFIRNLA